MSLVHSVKCQIISIPRDGAQFGFEPLPQILAFGVRCLARHAQDPADDDFTARERQRNLKPVPAFRADFPVQLNATGTMGKAGQLREGNHAFLNLVARSARAVRRDGQVVAALGPGRQFRKACGPRRLLTRAPAARRTIPECPRETRRPGSRSPAPPCPCRARAACGDFHKF